MDHKKLTGRQIQTLDVLNTLDAWCTAQEVADVLRSSAGGAGVTLSNLCRLDVPLVEAQQGDGFGDDDQPDEYMITHEGRRVLRICGL